MRSYSTHKRFIADVVRSTDPEIVSEASSHFISLRSCSVLKNIKDEQISWVVSKIVNTNLVDVYKNLYNNGTGLTYHQIVARIKRVKYIEHKNGDMKFLPTSVLSELATIFKSEITIPFIEVKRMTETEPSETEKINVIDVTNIIDVNKKKEEQLTWILENVSWKGRDGHMNKGKMSAADAEKILHITALRIRGIIRDYYKSKPLPSNSETSSVESPSVETPSVETPSNSEVPSNSE